MSNKNLKIAMLGHKRIPSREGGIEIVVEQLSKRLTAFGCEVTAYNRSGENVAGREFGTANGLKEYAGIKIKTVPTPKSKQLNAFIYSALATVRAIFGGYDVIHYHAEGPAAMCFLPRLFHIPTVVTIHGLDWQRSKWGGFATKYLKFGEKNAAKYADEIIVLSRSVEKYFLDSYGRKTNYIPNGIETATPVPAEIITEKFSLEKDGFLLYLGRIVPEKGIHYLLEAYSKCKASLPLVIAGGASHSREYFDSLKAQAAEIEKQHGGKKIIFTDFVQGKELEELYSNAYIYILPSDLEGMPISLLEAMSYSNCCLTSNIPECTEVCGDRAVYFEKGNPESLSEKLDMLCGKPELVFELKAGAAKYITEKFDWNSVAKSTLELYLKAAQKRK